MACSSSVGRCLFRYISMSRPRRSMGVLRSFASTDPSPSAQRRETNEKPKAANPFRYNTLNRPARQTVHQPRREREPRGGAHMSPTPNNKKADHTEEKKASAESARQPTKPNNKKADHHTEEKKTQKGYGSKSRRKPRHSNYPSSCWVEVHGIPILSKLDDVLKSVGEVLDFEKERGIVDLDATTSQMKHDPLPLLDLKEEEQWVLSAKLVLSTYYRPLGWRLRFANRSIANAFLQHTNEYSFFCAWKPVTISGWDPKEETKNTPKHNNEDRPIEPHELQVSDATLRVENCPDAMTVDNMRLFLRRYELSMEPPSIQKIQMFKGATIFIVQFEDASWARAAIRELQGATFFNHELRLCPYPKQLP